MIFGGFGLVDKDPLGFFLGYDQYFHTSPKNHAPTIKVAKDAQVDNVHRAPLNARNVEFF